MAVLKLGQTVSTREPEVQVEGPLEPGKYVAELVITGPRGRSAPARLTITVLARRPTVAPVPPEPPPPNRRPRRPPPPQ
jgi:hypothetical protein